MITDTLRELSNNKLICPFSYDLISVYRHYIGSENEKLNELAESLRETNTDGVEERYKLYTKEIKALLKDASIRFGEDCAYDEIAKQNTTNRFNKFKKVLATPSVFDTKRSYIEDSANFIYILIIHKNEAYRDIALSILEKVIYT